MKKLDAHTICRLLEDLGTNQNREKHSAIIRHSTKIDGCNLARQLSRIIDEAVVTILSEMQMPEEVSIVGVGGTGREEVTLGSDLDIICYVPNAEHFEESVATPYRQNMWKVFGALGIDGEPTVWVPGDFLQSDLLTIASMNLDARLLYGGTIQTMEEIQKKVRAVCDPFFVASMHEKELQKFSYKNESMERDEFSVDFDIKEDRGGLRHLQHILWLLAAIRGTNLQNMYTEVQKDAPEVYAALDLMLHIRSWLHLQKIGSGDKKIDLLNGSFWPALREQFGENIIEKMQNSRRAIIRYERTKILGEKKKGISIGDGTTYGLLGLEIDNTSWRPKEDLVLQILINAQKTGLHISPLVFSGLENEARKHMIRPNNTYATLLTESGKFSETVRRLISLGIIDQVFPFFGTLQNQTHSAKHPHADITLVGGIVERLENLEIIIGDKLKDIHDELTPEQQAGIRIALTCKDIPTIVEISLPDYFMTIEKIHPTLPDGLACAKHLMEKGTILFHCSGMDDWYDQRELKRIALEIGTPGQLDMMLVYTCAALDYGKNNYHHKSRWDKTFSLYHALKEELEGNTPENHRAKMERETKKRSWLSPEQIDILDTASDTFLQSRYVTSSDDLSKTMICLQDVQETENPQIKVTQIGGGIRIIVSTEYQTELVAIITGNCFRHNITINDAEVHTFKARKSLVVLFLEADFNIPNITLEGQESLIAKLIKNLQENIQTLSLGESDYRNILKKSKPNYLLENTNRTMNYKFIVKAEHDTPGFLYALTRLIAEAGVDILSTSIYTYPGHNGTPPHIEDTFILGPKNIQKLEELIARETEPIYSSPDSSEPQ